MEHRHIHSIQNLSPYPRTNIDVPMLQPSLSLFHASYDLFSCFLGYQQLVSSQEHNFFNV